MDDVPAPVALTDLLKLLPAGVLLRQLPTPVAVLDDSGEQIQAVNAALAERCGCSESQLLDMDLQRLRQVVLAADPAHAGRGLCQHLHPIHLDGRRVLLWMSEHCSGEPAAPRKDDLTGLMTRRAFEERLRGMLAAAVSGTLIRFEVDQFKLINDAYGREAGNRLLSQLGALITSLVRGDDEPAHLGGDDFALVVDHADAERAWQIAERIRLQIAAQGFEWNGRAYGVTVSVGIATFADAFGDFIELMAAADMACEAAKARGRNRIEIYRREDHELNRLRGEQSWGARVLDTLEANRFALYRQRIDPLQAGSGKPHYEALLRVRASTGWTTPVEFVAAAERYGLMPQIDRRVIARVLRELSRLPPEQRPVMSINLSGHSLSDHTLAGYIARMLEYNEISPQNVRFEITETAAIANTASAVALVGALKDLGCSVALDDFGVGMSSFSYLKTLAVDVVKIDGSFVRNVTSDAVDAATIESMVKVAALRGLQTVAECVEDAEALDRLGQLGVHYAQGFHLHRPEPWSLP